MPAVLKSSPRLPCRKRQGCFCGHVPKRTRHQRAPAKHEAYQCGKLDLPPKRCPCPDRHTVGPLGRPPGASPVPLGRRWCGGSAGVLTSPSAAVQNSDFAHNCFYMSCVGRKRPDRADRMPPRAWEAIRRDRMGGAPSKSKYATFKLGSNVASQAANSLGRTTCKNPLRPESDR